jgi:hypothetical protein
MNYTMFISNDFYTGKHNFSLMPHPGGKKLPPMSQFDKLKPLPFDSVGIEHNQFVIRERINDRCVIYLDELKKPHLIYGFAPYPIEVDPVQLSEMPNKSFWKAGLPIAQNPSSEGFSVSLLERFDGLGILDREQAMISHAFKIPENSPLADDKETENYQTIYKKHIQSDRPDSDSRDAPEVSRTERRYDFRKRLVYTIDDESSKDMDDAVEIKQLDDGSYLLGVHIADVTAFVAPETPRNLDARDRATSHYLADRVIHMLPECLASDLCSLKPGEDRLAVSMYMNVIRGANGPVISSVQVARSTIQSRRKLTYSQVQQALERFDSQLDPEISQSLHLAGELADLLQQNEIQESDFNSNEKLFYEADQKLACRELPNIRSRDIIKQFMVAANQEVGRKIADLMTGTAGPQTPLGAYRVQIPPKETAIQKYIRLLQQEGLLESRHSYEYFQNRANALFLSRPYGDEISRVDAKSAIRSLICYLIQKEIPDTIPGANYKRQALTRLAGGNYPMFQKAKLSSRPDQSYHHQMRIHRYAWFTSPIRRYPDIINHRQLIAAIQGKTYEFSGIDALTKKIKNQNEAQKQLTNRLNFLYRFQNIRFFTRTRLWFCLHGFRWINPSELCLEGHDDDGNLKCHIIGSHPVSIGQNGLVCKIEKVVDLAVGSVISVVFPKTIGHCNPETGKIYLSPNQFKTRTR